MIKNAKELVNFLISLVKVYIYKLVSWNLREFPAFVITHNKYFVILKGTQIINREDLKIAQ